MMSLRIVRAYTRTVLLGTTWAGKSSRPVEHYAHKRGRRWDYETRRDGVTLLLASGLRDSFPSLREARAQFRRTPYYRRVAA
jgi:hypothetical protein